MKNLALRQFHRTSVYTTCAVCVYTSNCTFDLCKKDADIFHSFWRDCQLSSKTKRVACAETCALLSLPRIPLRLKSTSTQEFYSPSNFFRPLDRTNYLTKIDTRRDFSDLDLGRRTLLKLRPLARIEISIHI